MAATVLTVEAAKAANIPVVENNKYTQVVHDTVTAYGGRIAIVGDPKDHSTRDLLSRIRSLQ